jgi:hypothetical protein
MTTLSAKAEVASAQNNRGIVENPAKVTIFLPHEDHQKQTTRNPRWHLSKTQKLTGFQKTYRGEAKESEPFGRSTIVAKCVSPFFFSAHRLRISETQK